MFRKLWQCKECKKVRTKLHDGVCPKCGCTSFFEKVGKWTIKGWRFKGCSY